MSTLANPDDRRDNAEKLQDHIADTQDNLRQAEMNLRAHGHEMSDSDKADIEAKNERRRVSIEGFREEIGDETGHAPSGKNARQ